MIIKARNKDHKWEGIIQTEKIYISVGNKEFSIEHQPGEELVINKIENSLSIKPVCSNVIEIK
jgi:hypothetical protein